MNIKKAKKLLGLNVLVEINPELEIETACGSDLMSDVLAFSSSKTILLTGLTNIQVVRTAEMIDLKAVIFVRNKTPEQETIELAQKKGISLYKAPYSLFACCGLLYQAGVKPEPIKSFK